MTPQAYLYICDGDIDSPVLTQKKMDWPEKYPHWQEIPLVMAQRQWVGLSIDDVFEMASGGWTLGQMAVLVEAKLKEKNT